MPFIRKDTRGLKNLVKNVEDGSNKHYLRHEIKHGTVVVRGHDGDGKEVYRSTLQPHHNAKGHVVYALDSEYGIKHPNFTAHSHDVAKRLSSKTVTSGIYKKHPNVYNDNGITHIMHPNATADHITKALRDKDWVVRASAISHPNATAAHVTKALGDEDRDVRRTAIRHPSVNADHITKALGDKDRDVRRAAIRTRDKHLT